MKPCKQADCGEPPLEFALCLLHYNQWLRSTAHLPRCAWDGCERPMQVRGMCSKHAQRVRYNQGARTTWGARDEGNQDSTAGGCRWA